MIKVPLEHYGAEQKKRTMYCVKLKINKNKTNIINKDDPHLDSLDKPEKCSAVIRERTFITSSLCRFEVCSHIAECSGENGTPGGDPKIKGGDS